MINKIPLKKSFITQELSATIGNDFESHPLSFTSGSFHKTDSQDVDDNYECKGCEDNDLNHYDQHKHRSLLKNRDKDEEHIFNEMFSNFLKSKYGSKGFSYKGFVKFYAAKLMKKVI